MKISKVRSLYFSPTGTSKKIVEAIAAGCQEGGGAEQSNLTYPTSFDNLECKADELVIIGVPVYAGRVAPLAVERLQTIKGNGAAAVLVVLYGNREFEDALVELQDLAKEIGFQPVAGSAFIGEHSFSTMNLPIADGRPDDDDLRMAKAFGEKIAGHLGGMTDDISESLVVPGNVPYKDGMGSLPFSPTFNVGMCTGCGFCIETCPSGAISLEGELEVDAELCIFCCACVKTCPEGAVTVEAPPLKEKMVWLHENCKKRKEPQLFF